MAFELGDFASAFIIQIDRSVAHAVCTLTGVLGTGESGHAPLEGYVVGL